MRQLSFKSVMLVFVGIVFCLALSIIICAFSIKSNNTLGKKENPVSVVLEVEADLHQPF